MSNERSKTSRNAPSRKAKEKRQRKSGAALGQSSRLAAKFSASLKSVRQVIAKLAKTRH